LKLPGELVIQVVLKVLRVNISVRYVPQEQGIELLKGLALLYG
jgi:hypothetical protein